MRHYKEATIRATIFVIEDRTALPVKKNHDRSRSPRALKRASAKRPVIGEKIRGSLNPPLASRLRATRIFRSRQDLETKWVKCAT